MRFYTPQHPFYCGIDLHARTMYVGILHHDGESVVQRDMQAGPETFLKAIAPYREDLGVAVACIFTWDWLADLGAPQGLPFVRGHALSRTAIHGGKAQNDRMDARQIAVRLRGGRIPPTSVSPAAMRATRALRRRRLPLTRQRAELLAPVQHTNSQYHLPELGKPLASKAPRDGVAARFPAPAVQQRGAVDLALLDYDDRLRSDVAVPIVPPAKPHDAQPLSRLQSVPGMGKMLRWGLRSERHDLTRFPRGQDGLSSCRRGKGAQESAGQRDGTSGAKSGHASLTGAFSEAAGLCLRNTPAGQTSLARLAPHHGKGTA